METTLLMSLTLILLALLFACLHGVLDRRREDSAKNTERAALGYSIGCRTISSRGAEVNCGDFLPLPIPTCLLCKHRHRKGAQFCSQCGRFRGYQIRGPDPLLSNGPITTTWKLT